ncbi:hypothetical protein SPRG_03067 [Saprolegnia parasitica CBS 223.65]|uniref:Uncharacterized protein n=1 Tax=Saprolegnia parasitica (strain CBS 223.65) TaxID=695850 RepID=A0A067CQ09_SAPPC|nr:hypothetical protein SPRG_03067 [Saprolegnia parasitica CBS 223.65]KDO32593.1 hypothetical protein SPRG_03067 [Saprolegnia parasitica CBS 223.65]|eukprot:XP_012197038.1 hypothetical protein SPRG_03067 [Saprolegnia parasitica CBS 223.65]
MTTTKPCPLAMSPTKPMTPTAKTPKAVDRSVRTRSQFHITFPSKAFLDLETPEPAIHEGSARRCCVKYGASVFSHVIVPKTPSDVVERTTSVDEAKPYLPYTTRKPQVPPVPQLPSLLEFRAKNESEAHTLTKTHAMSASQAMLEKPGISKDSGTCLNLTNDPPPRSTYVADLAQSLENMNPSPHGIERLQDVVRARERTKQVFCLKFAHFKLQRDLPGDLCAMRQRAEADRQDRIHVAVEASTWFTGFLSLVLKYTPSSSSPAPALLFLTNSIRDSVNQGHEFQPALLLGLVLCLYENELEADATQAALKFLRSAAGISMVDWERFFENASLPPPIEVVNQRQADSQGKGKHMRMKHLVKTAGMMSHLKGSAPSDE